MSDEPDYDTVLRQKLPANIYKMLMFFDHKTFMLPPNFTSMKASERKQWREKLKVEAEPPTKENWWIWFGAHSAEGSPVYENKSVVRQIYTSLFGDLTYDGKRQRRLVNSLTDMTSDVNPFKYLPSTGVRYALENSDELPSDVSDQIKYDWKQSQQIREGSRILTLYKDFLPPEHRLPILLAHGYSEKISKITINKFLKENPDVQQ